MKSYKLIGTTGDGMWVVRPLNRESKQSEVNPSAHTLGVHRPQKRDKFRLGVRWHLGVVRRGRSEVYSPDKFETAAKEPTLRNTTQKRLHLLGGPLGLTTVSRKPTRTQRTARQELSTELEPR